MESSKQLAIGVDVGATKIAAALVGQDGQVFGSSQVLTEAAEGPEAVLDRIATQIATQIASQIDETAGTAAGQILGIGIGCPGQVLSGLGVVRNAVNLGWKEINLVEEIRSRLPHDLPVWIQKDANASALGEYYFGAAQACKDFVYLGVGSGLGGGILTNGMLVTGANWNAAELGHLSLDPQGLPCNCGQRGCAETIVSGPGLLSVTQRYLEKHAFSTRLSPTGLTTAKILEAARAGDELALAALSETGRHLGIVMAACVAVLNPARFVIGGGLGLAAFDYLATAARQEMELRTLPASHENLRIVPSRLASSAVGAACLVWYFSASGFSIEKR